MVKKVYVIALEDGCYYVGQTENLKRRLKEHAAGGAMASEWTKLHRPIEPVEAIVEHVVETVFDEDTVTKMCMREFGIDKVRGGSYSTPYLSPAQIALLEKELIHASGACFRCKRTSHMASECYAKTDVNGNPLYAKDDDDEDEDDDDDIVCTRCKRTSHVSSDCYANTDAYGDPICDDGDDDDEGDDAYCFRCKRAGHIASSCYARTDVSGRVLEFNTSNNKRQYSNNKRR